ncbi:hypothetical protein AB0C84_44900 [Actinomadura sp. NPDC048955]|uniref:hypothetical protein n=1 Tax=Actinomadura sp. NPDC048955 TaxID=3158228 RepID=UPI0033D64761
MGAGGLPRVFREGAPRWVLAEMAVRVDALLAEGRTPIEIVRAAEEVPPPIGPRGHLDALHAVRAALRTNGYDRQADEVAAGVVRCEGCGARRTGARGCPNIRCRNVASGVGGQGTPRMCSACQRAAAALTAAVRQARADGGRG